MALLEHPHRALAGEVRGPLVRSAGRDARSDRDDFLGGETTSDFFITFIAKYLPLGLCNTRYTIPKVPVPASEGRGAKPDVS